MGCNSSSPSQAVALVAVADPASVKVFDTSVGVVGPGASGAYAIRSDYGPILVEDDHYVIYDLKDNNKEVFKVVGNPQRKLTLLDVATKKGVFILKKDGMVFTINEDVEPSSPQYSSERSKNSRGSRRVSFTANEECLYQVTPQQASERLKTPETELPIQLTAKAGPPMSMKNMTGVVMLGDKVSGQTIALVGPQKNYPQFDSQAPDGKKWRNDDCILEVAPGMDVALVLSFILAVIDMEFAPLY